MVDIPKDKPVFAYTDAELKSIGYDLLQELDAIQRNLQMIRSEIERRRHKVIAEMTPEQVQHGIFKAQISK